MRQISGSLRVRITIHHRHGREGRATSRRNGLLRQHGERLQAGWWSAADPRIQTAAPRGSAPALHGFWPASHAADPW